MNKVVWRSETPPPAVRYVPANVRTCRSCGSEERVIHRAFKEGFGMTAFLDCGHFQNDDEY